MDDSFLVSYELASKLKYLGFDEECIAYYASTLGFNDSKLIISKTPKNFYRQITIPEEFYTLAPTYQQVQEWLEKPDIGYSVGVHRGTSGYYVVETWKFKGGSDGWERLNGMYGFKTRNEALNEGIEQILKIIS